MNILERPSRPWVVLAAVAVVLSACSEDNDAASATTAPPATSATPTTSAHENEHDVPAADRVAAMLATAAYQDVATAEAAGYASSLDTFGCFTDPAAGGMGLHFIDESLLDDRVDIAEPEALVYELDANADIVGLVAHEHIVPIDAWTEPTPPQLFGIDFHQHPTLPLWVLHAWLWKDDPAGIFEDWNPAVRPCPPGVPIFGEDLPN